MKKTFMALTSILVIGTAAAVIMTSINSAQAKVKRLEPSNVALTELALISSSDSLVVVVSWTAGTVNNPTEAILTNLDWFRNSALVDSLRLSTQLLDTMRICRAPLGGTDTVSVNINSNYKNRDGPTASATAVFDNPDLQVPSVPIITSLDTACAGSTCP